MQSCQHCVHSLPMGNENVVWCSHRSRAYSIGGVCRDFASPRDTESPLPALAHDLTRQRLYAVHAIGSGLSRDRIASELVERGSTLEEAEEVISSANAERLGAARRAVLRGARRELITGSFWFVASLALLIFAISSTGGDAGYVYLLPFGFFVWGAVSLIRGMVLFNRAFQQSQEW